MNQDTFCIHCGAAEGEYHEPHCPLLAQRNSASDRQVGGDHYKKLKPEPWEVMRGWNREHFIGFLRYSALKRLARWDSKDGALMDVQKAIHELQQLVEVLEEGDGQVPR